MGIKKQIFLTSVQFLLPQNAASCGQSINCARSSGMDLHFLKRPSGVPLHTLSKSYYVPVGIVTPSFHFRQCVTLFAVAEGWLILDIGLIFLLLHEIKTFLEDLCYTFHKSLNNTYLYQCIYLPRFSK